jgi:hypothetical protein
VPHGHIDVRTTRGGAGRGSPYQSLCILKCFFDEIPL